MLTITLLGTGGPVPDPHRAGPATLIGGGSEQYLVDAGRGVLMRLAAAGGSAAQLRAVLLTHLHSDHITDLNDVITTRWITTFEPSPLTIVGPAGTERVVAGIGESLGPDIGYRIAHHDDLDYPPPVEVIEATEGEVFLGGDVRITCAPTDHRPVEPTVAFRFDYGGSSVVAAGDTVPCAGLDRLCKGAQALVHTVIRKEVVSTIPIPRVLDTLDYHSSPAQAAQTAARAGMRTLVLTHYFPPPAAGDDDAYRALAAEHFDGTIEVGDDLHRVEVRA